METFEKQGKSSVKQYERPRFPKWHLRHWEERLMSPRGASFDAKLPSNIRLYIFVQQVLRRDNHKQLKTRIGDSICFWNISAAPAFKVKLTGAVTQPSFSTPSHPPYTYFKLKQLKHNQKKFLPFHLPKERVL